MRISPNPVGRGGGGWGRRNFVISRRHCHQFRYKQNIGREAAEKKFVITESRWSLLRALWLKRGRNIAKFFASGGEYNHLFHYICYNKIPFLARPDSDRLLHRNRRGHSGLLKSRKLQKNCVPTPPRIAFITKLPRAFAPYEKQKSTKVCTNTASDRLYNEIAEGIRAL